MKIAIEIPDNLFHDLPSETAKTFENEEILSRFCSEACKEALGWISGNRVYTSLTDQHLHWIEIYFPVLYPNTKPTANRLYNDFMIPAGRAAYMARILAEKRQSQWRSEARDELISTMGGKKAEADKFMKNKEYFERIPITISAMAERELRSIEVQIFEEDKTISTYRTTIRKPDIVTVEIPARTFTYILERMTEV